MAALGMSMSRRCSTAHEPKGWTQLAIPGRSNAIRVLVRLAATGTVELCSYRPHRRGRHKMVSQPRILADKKLALIAKLHIHDGLKPPERYYVIVRARSSSGLFGNYGKIIDPWALCIAFDGALHKDFDALYATVRSNRKDLAYHSFL